MRISLFLVALATATIVRGCADQPHYSRIPGPGPQPIPPPPQQPKIEGRVESVSAADIREVILLKQQDMVKEFGTPLPIYTVRVHSKDHIEVQFWEPEGVEVWRDARRVKGKWKFDKLVDVIHLTEARHAYTRDLTKRCPARIISHDCVKIEIRSKARCRQRWLSSVSLGVIAPLVLSTMKTTISRVLLAAAFALIACRSTSAQEVHTTNIVMETKERVLRIESIIPAPPKEVWKAFSTEEGLKKWMAPVVALDLRIGGSISAHYDKNASIGSPGTIRSAIVNYLEGELITYKVNLTSSFASKVRAEDQNLQEVVQIVPWTNGTTKVISSMIGWGTGKEWDDTYNFFAKGNAWSYKQLVKCFSEERK